MSNYSTLKAAISAVIKENNNHEITGQVLQTTLLAMVDSLADGYLFKGVATPATVVGTPDENVFYIGGAGTYSNFGATPVNVPDCCIGIFTYNGSFENHIIPTGGVFDISAYNAVGGTPATYADLTAALGTNGANIPDYLRKGGMSVKFIQGSVPSSDNKYVQFRLMKKTWSTDIKDWAVCSSDVLTNDPEFLYVMLDSDENILLALRKDGTVYYGAGIPPQVKNYISNKIAELPLDEYEDIVTFLGNLIEGDNTLQELLNGKVDKVAGKGLSKNDYTDSDKRLVELNTLTECPEFIEVLTDSNDGIIEGITTEGKKKVMIDVEMEKNLSIKENLTVGGKIIGFEDRIEYNIIFASFDSSEKDKKIADYVCTETNAQEVIQTAIDNWYANNNLNTGSFLFCAGTYNMTHFIEPEPDGDDRNGTPYCILMPRGKVANSNPSSKAHHVTQCIFSGPSPLHRSDVKFVLLPSAYLLKADGTTEPLDDFKDDTTVYQSTDIAITGQTLYDTHGRYLVDNKRYSVIRCVTDPLNPGYSMWCSYLMRIQNMQFILGGSAEDRTLTNYPIVMIDGLYTSALYLDHVSVTVASGIFAVNNSGADNFNEALCGIRCNQGQSWGYNERMSSVSVNGYYHGIEFGSEHWTIEDLIILQCHVGLAFGCYHDIYGSGHQNVFNGLGLERNYYPMYFYYNGRFDNLNWIDSGVFNIIGLGTEWFKYEYGGEATTGSHIESYNKRPCGYISCGIPSTVQLFDTESRQGLIEIQMFKNNLYKNWLWSTGEPEHGIQTMVGEHGQQVYLTDKHCFAIWNNYNQNNPYHPSLGYWEKLDGSAIV